MHKQKWNSVAEDVSFNLEIDLDRFRNYIPTESRILDFGCGYGRISKVLWESGNRNIIGIDLSTKMIERGKREFPELHLETTTKKTLPYLDNSFDAIVACAVFTCITSQEVRLQQMKELYRVLKPEGLLHMVEFCSEPRKSFTANIGIPMLHSSPKELRGLVRTLQIVNEEIVNANTMNGHSASSYSLFARKALVQS